MKHKTSWQGVQKWYNQSVGEQGHYYHQKIVMPGVVRLLKLDSKSRLLDLACGQGVLARQIPKNAEYSGVDVAPSLIKEAKKLSSHEFHVCDVTKQLPLKGTYTHAAIVLALQNIADPLAALQNASKWLEPKGSLVLALNHPCFRIPRQTSWGVDEAKKLQYRRVDRYMTPLEIPIQMHPGKSQEETVSYHFALTDLFKWLNAAGFVVEKLEEWCSDKESTGKAAKMENRARDEFPLFLAVQARKL